MTEKAPPVAIFRYFDPAARTESGVIPEEVEGVDPSTGQTLWRVVLPRGIFSPSCVAVGDLRPLSPQPEEAEPFCSTESQT